MGQILLDNLFPNIYLQYANNRWFVILIWSTGSQYNYNIVCWRGQRDQCKYFQKELRAAQILLKWSLLLSSAFQKNSDFPRKIVFGFLQVDGWAQFCKMLEVTRSVSFSPHHLLKNTFPSVQKPQSDALIEWNLHHDRYHHHHHRHDHHLGLL